MTASNPDTAPAPASTAPDREPCATPLSRAECHVCPHRCNLAEGQLGLCRARRALDGTVVDENYGRLTSAALDPIEKKPLARFRPGTHILSVGSYGCNLHCPFCQNASIACAGEGDVNWRFMTPQQVVDLALDTRPHGNIGIAFTYNEPLVGFEFVRDTAQLAHENDLVTVLVSNGMVNPEPLAALVPLIDAANIDLKGFTQRFYDFVGGSLDAVKATIETLAAAPTCHLEVTTLVIPGMNDSPEEIDGAARWLASLDQEIPYHLTRFFPCHNMRDAQATDPLALHGLAAVARKQLAHVYVGNV